jgi:tetratricopeptide (TPR) repeat protein
VQRRQELFEAVQARLSRVNQTGSLAPVLEPEAFEEGRLLAQALNTEGDDLPARRALGWMYWLQYNGLPEGPDQEALDAALTVLTRCFMAGAGILPEPLLPALAERAAPEATAILRLAVGQPRRGASEAFEPVVLDTAVEVWTRIAAGVAGRPIQAAYLSNLCGALQARADRTGLPADLDAAVDVGRRALDTSPPGHRLHAPALSNLAGALRARYEHQREPRDLDEAIDALRRAVAATPEPGSDRRRYLTNFAVAMHLRFDRTGASADLKEAISAARASAASTPDGAPTRSARFVTLTRVLLRRYELSGLSADFDEAIAAAASAVAAAPEGHRDRASLVAMLGEMLRMRAARTKSAADFDAAVTLAREAAALTADADRGSKAARLGEVSR